jgi:Ca-activated chloride channel family protein
VNRLLPGVLAFLAAVSQAAAQSPSPSPPPLRIEVDVGVVSVTAVVQDKAGRFVHGLTPKDVEIYEDGVRQEVSYFREASGKEEARIPLSVVLVLDASGSMSKNLSFLQEAAAAFLRKLEEGDQAMVVQFNESVKGSAEFTGDTERLEQFVEAVQAWGGTALYDAVHYALNRIRDRPGRKAVVVFSDGDDNRSDLKEQEVLDYARAVEATVYCIGIRGEGGLWARGPRGFLRKIASESGGAFFFPERVGELMKVFFEISSELNNHYLLSYVPKRPPDGAWREIRMTLQRKDAEVRLRKGYFAVKRRGQ